MAYTNTWDETAPLGSALVSTVDDIIRQLKLDLRERLSGGSSDFNNGRMLLASVAATSGSPNLLKVTGPAHTGLAASTEAADILLDLARTVTFLTGTLAAQRAVKITPPTYAFATASTLTKAATVAITGAPTAGANATITDAYALLVEAGVARFEGEVELGDNLQIDAGGYVNFGTTVGETGYGIRENSGVVELKNSGGSWGTLIPVGAVMPFAGSSEPSGWLLCAGQAVSRTTYAALFAVIGGTYGVGDGSTTFNLPDLRGRAVFGKDDMGGSAASRITSASGITGTTLGSAGGTQTHTLTSGEMPAHTHTIPASVDFGAVPCFNYLSGIGETSVTSSSVGGGGAHQNMPPAMIMNYIIRY